MCLGKYAVFSHLRQNETGTVYIHLFGGSSLQIYCWTVLSQYPRLWLVRE